MPAATTASAAGEPAGVVGDGVEELAVGRNEALERRLEVARLVRLGRDRDGVDARPPRCGDEGARHRPDDAVRQPLLRVLRLRELAVDARQRRRLAVERDHAHRQPHRRERLPAPRGATARCSTARSPSSDTPQSASRAVVSASRRGRRSIRRAVMERLGEPLRLREAPAPGHEPDQRRPEDLRQRLAPLPRPDVGHPSRASSGSRARSSPAIQCRAPKPAAPAAGDLSGSPAAPASYPECGSACEFVHARSPAAAALQPRDPARDYRDGAPPSPIVPGRTDWRP